MSLFDSKQEIINIELTSFGRKSLAKGKFNPTYYAFFDDEVIYDYEYASVTENANGTGDVRIRTETPYSKTLYSIVGAETKLNKSSADLDKLDNVRLYENTNILKFPLGNSKIGEVTGSQISVNLLEGEITNVYTTASSYIFGTSTNPKTAYDKPQTRLVTKTLDLMPEIRSMPDPSMTTPPELLDPNRIEPAVVSPVLTDNKYIYLEVDELLLAVDELNSIEDYTNFEISLYKIEVNENNEEEYKKLNFKTKENQIDENGFLLDENQINRQNSTITSDDAEFYFDIQVDEEIDPALLTSKVARDAMGYPVLDDPLIQNTIEIRRNADFSRRRDDDGEPC